MHPLNEETAKEVGLDALYTPRLIRGLVGNGTYTSPLNGMSHRIHRMAEIVASGLGPSICVTDDSRSSQSAKICPAHDGVAPRLKADTDFERTATLLSKALVSVLEDENLLRDDIFKTNIVGLDKDIRNVYDNSLKRKPDFTMDKAVKKFITGKEYSHHQTQQAQLKKQANTNEHLLKNTQQRILV